MSATLILALALGAAPLEESAPTKDGNTFKRVQVSARSVSLAQPDKNSPQDYAWSLRYRPVVIRPTADGGYRLSHGELVEYKRKKNDRPRNEAEAPK